MVADESVRIGLYSLTTQCTMGISQAAIASCFLFMLTAESDKNFDLPCEWIIFRFESLPSLLLLLAVPVSSEHEQSKQVRDVQKQQPIVRLQNYNNEKE